FWMETGGRSGGVALTCLRVYVRTCLRFLTSNLVLLWKVNAESEGSNTAFGLSNHWQGCRSPEATQRKHINTYARKHFFLFAGTWKSETSSLYWMTTVTLLILFASSFPVFSPPPKLFKSSFSARTK